MANRPPMMKWQLLRAITCIGITALTIGMQACGSNSTDSGEATGTSNPNVSKQATSALTVEFPLKGETFHLELAMDGDSRTQGLSDRKSIADDGGMLFVFPTPRNAQFVMRRCYVPIDLIFIDEDGYIDSLHAMDVIEPIGGARWKNPSLGYATAGSILYAVELKGGKIAELGLKRGEKITLSKAVLQLKAQ